MKESLCFSRKLLRVTNREGEIVCINVAVPPWTLLNIITVHHLVP